MRERSGRARTVSGRGAQNSGKTSFKTSFSPALLERERAIIERLDHELMSVEKENECHAPKRKPLLN